MLGPGEKLTGTIFDRRVKIEPMMYIMHGFGKIASKKHEKYKTAFTFEQMMQAGWQKKGLTFSMVPV